MATPEFAPQSESESSRNILIVDDDIGLRESVAAYLAEHGFETHVAGDAGEMAEQLRLHDIDLILLDVMLPGEDGLSICRRLAGVSSVAILMHSALGDEIDRVLGLELGADDYLPKPCSPRELLAKVRALLRTVHRGRSAQSRRDPTYRFNDFTLSVLHRRLQAGSGHEILLTAGEIALLTVFLDRPREVLSRDRLLELVRGANPDVCDRVIDVQISRLRRKLSVHGVPDLLHTHRGVGYLLEAEVQCP